MPTQPSNPYRILRRQFLLLLPARMIANSSETNNTVNALAFRKNSL